MKSTFILVILLLSNYILKAKLNSNTIQATKVDLTDTSKNVIGKMVFIPGLRRNIFLKDYTRIKDSTGLYVTGYRFIQPNHLEAKNVILIFQLQKFETVDYKIDGDSTDFKTNIADDKYSTSIAIQNLPIDAVITVMFKSKKILVPTITGIGGQLSFKRN